MRKVLIKIFIKNIKKFTLIVCLIFGALIFFNPMFIFKFKTIDNSLKNLGFQLNKVAIYGNNKVIESDIKNKLVFQDCENLFCLDLKKTKVNLETNEWIKSVKLKFGLPSKLVIKIEEEEPIFILRNNKKTSLLNAEGKKIQDIKKIPNDFKNLLVLSGYGVENKVINLLDIISVNKNVSEHIREATLVSSRRWSLKHSLDIVIELPEKNPDKAFFKIVQLEEKYGFLSYEIKKVDLRVSGRMIIQLKNKNELLKENNI
jgi:cell division protein FtsQ